jgi:uncharacterized Zn-finger protein
LREENDRLLSKLFMANNRINILDKFRLYLLEICHKFDLKLDENYKKEINLLEINYKQINESKQLDNKEVLVINNDINNSLAFNKSNNNNNEIDINSNININIKEENESSTDESNDNIDDIRNSLLQRLSLFKNDINLSGDNMKKDVSKQTEIKVSIKQNNEKVLNSINKTIESENIIERNEKKSLAEIKRKKNKKSLSSNKPRFRCDYENCSFKAHIRRLVDDHKNAIHTGERPYVCPFSHCGKSYASLCYLNKHKLHVHSNQKFKCEWNGCEVEVKSKKSLKVHMRRHTGEKTFDCDFPGCSFRGTNIFSINDHKNKHTGEKPYKCKYESCDATFSYRSTRFTHYVRAHSDVRRFACDWPGCESAFKDNQALKLHKFTHTGEKSLSCEWPGCDYRCSNGSLLKKHKLVHTQEKKYVCSWPECDVKYSSLSSLKNHIMKHKGEKPNECQFCGKGFREKNNLRRHYKTHNKDFENKL